MYYLFNITSSSSSSYHSYQLVTMPALLFALCILANNRRKDVQAVPNACRVIIVVASFTAWPTLSIWLCKYFTSDVVTVRLRLFLPSAAGADTSSSSTGTATSSNASKRLEI